MKKLITMHFGFILTASVTYFIGLSLVLAQYYATTLVKNTNTDLIQMFFDTLMPTTITYVLGCVLVNIVDLFEKGAKDYYYNVATCVFVMMYVIFYCIYLISGRTTSWNIFEIILTIILLWLNIMSYREKYKQQYHDLV